MATGTIKKLVGDRGFGFIALADAPASGKDLFFHRADVGGAGFDALREGEAVTYDLGTDERRGSPKALNVKASK
ncbi:MAG: cold shock domain-containing protein [bacterium]